MLPWCQAHDVALVAYSPFGSGSFPAPEGAGGRRLEAIAQRHSATPRQVALAYLLRHEGAFVIPKASKAVHVEENAKAATVTLTGTDLRELDHAFPRGPRPAELPML